MVKINKLRVLQVITKSEWAGAQRVVYELCKNIQEDYRNEIEMEVAVGDRGLLVHKLRELGIQVHILSSLNIAFILRWIIKAIKN